MFNKNKDSKSNGKQGIFSIFKKDKGTILKLSLVLLAGLFLMVLSNMNSGQANNTSDIVPHAVSTASETNDKLQASVEAILANIKGAGKVQVLITYESSSISEYSQTENTSERRQSEHDAEGGVKETAETTKNTSLSMSGANNQPVLIAEHSPKVRGVLVVASGASDINVKNQLFLAVEALLGLPPHRIVITESK